MREQFCTPWLLVKAWSTVGLIVTDLVINSIKYAFPQALVTYEIDGVDWKLRVSDNGVGTRPITASAAPD